MITRKEAKIRALLYMHDQSREAPYFSPEEFSPYEVTKIKEELDKISDALANRISKLGANPNCRFDERTLY